MAVGTANMVAGHEGTRKPSIAESLQLEMPHRHSESIRSVDADGSSSEDTQGPALTNDVEVQSVVGISINRAQTRLASFQAPAAEKAKALEAGDGIFETSSESGLDESVTNRKDYGNSQSRGRVIGSGLASESLGPGRSSPWRATAITFDSPRSKNQAGRPTSSSADLNVRRYVASFTLPSMPRTPSFKDFSVPSLGSILGTVRSCSPTRKGSARRKRANTIADTKPIWTSNDQYHKVSQAVQQPATVSSPAIRATTPLHKPESRADQSQLDKFPASESSTVAQTKSPMLRKSTSEQSLYILKATSTATSLGDDSRWENVQEQVNSRVKAIMDSLQDSNIKLPSLPNMPNLNAFRPDFKRTRAQSEAKPVSRPESLADYSKLATGGRADSQSILDQKGNHTMDTRPPQLRFSHLHHALEQLTGDIVIMGGYRGSILRSAKPPHRQLWVPVKVGLNIRRVNLAVGLKPEDEENMGNNIYASGMLTHIGPVDMGRRLLKRLQNCKNAREGKLRVHDYGYDWRLSPHLLSRRLIEFLEKLPSNQGGVPEQEQGAVVVAHSMGGLITRHVVNQRPQLFAGVVYAGVPQHCVNILGPLRNGDEVLLSSKVLTAQVNFSMRSSYLLLPDDGHCFVNKETKEEYPVDFYNIADWEEYAFSPCIAPVLPGASADRKGILGSIAYSLPSRPLSNAKRNASQQDNKADTTANKVARLAELSGSRTVDPQISHSPRPPNTEITISKAEGVSYLTRTLAEVLRFRQELAHNPSHEALNKYPPLAILYANNTPTVSAAHVSSRDAIKRADAYDDLQFASGDGVCLAKAAQLPEGYKAVPGGKVKTKRGHVGLLGDLEAVGKCLDAVWKARCRDRFGRGSKTPI
ncbi:MAG: hypothetical protein Q9163_002559 [Psora crenata]